MGFICFAISVVVLLLLTSHNSIFQFVNSASLTTDQEALLSFKSLVTDTSNHLSSWNQNNFSNVCNWTGVDCEMIYNDNNNRQQRGLRVVGIDLEGLGLSGTLSPYLGNLSFLQSLHLPNNKFSGTLPIQIGNLFRLRSLNMSSNNIQGQIPPDISRCTDLVVLDLMGNQVSGFIPPELGQSLSKLQVLKLNQNRISGTIPPSIGNILSLTTLNLGTNTIGGPIPDDLGRLQNLKELRLSINNLTGTIPPSLYNISSLMYFALPSNRLWGEIPSDIGVKLPNLIEFNFCINKFTGRIPGSLHYLKNIQVIRMADNLLEGRVPPGLENLRSLRMYNIGYNRIVGSLNFVSSFSNSPHLEFLALDGNLFEGVIPESIGFNLPAKSLTKLYLGGNRINGKIPASIGRLTNLALLNLSHNSISGEIPPEISQLKNLQMLGLAGNKISGVIPSSLGKLNKLNELELFGNEIVGSIPNSLGNLQRLLSMDLSRNKLSGSIPRQVLSGLSTLTTLLNLSRNSLNGPLPPEIGNLENVVAIDLSHNSFSGSIPGSIDGCKSLEELFMAGNSFSGPIPSTLGLVKGLETLDISSNQLSGPIPVELQNLQALQFLDLSFNNLEGKLPTNGVFRNLSRVHVKGNSKLCVSSSTWVCRRKKSFAARVIVPIIIALVAFCILVVLFACIFLIYRRKLGRGGKVRGYKNGNDEELFKGKHQMVSYEELRAGTENFDQKNLIGSGSFGSVYKGTIWGGLEVAVKVLNLDQIGASKSFFAECNALRNVRHRNLVKLITSCSTVDYRSNSEFRALVYELLSNGSLEDWIRGRRRTRSRDDEEDAVVLTMNGMERLNVAIDVASALDYLHHDCEAPVVHCDIKPSNVILDEDMTAKVGDFGLARTLMLNNVNGDNPSTTTTSTYGLKGSIGYIPPEYGLGGKASTRGDVYSYGVMLLEMFTGRCPTHQDFNGGMSLVKWVESAYPTNIMQVLDPQMLQHHDHNHNQQLYINKEKEEEECWVTIMGIGLSCTVDYPEARITIREALHKLKTLRDNASSNLGGRAHH